MIYNNDNRFVRRSIKKINKLFDSRMSYDEKINSLEEIRDYVITLIETMEVDEEMKAEEQQKENIIARHKVPSL